MKTSGPFVEFFDPLVGSPQAIDDFHNALVSYVQNSTNNPALPNDPYERLYAGIESQVDAFVSREGAKENFWHWFVQGFNAKIGGTLTVKALEAVGQLYEANTDPDIPQDVDVVRPSVRKALGYVMSLATTDRPTTRHNLAASQAGWNPRGLLSRLRRGGLPGSFSEDIKHLDLRKAFKVVKDQNGQVHLSVRYRNQKSDTEAHCPAIHTRTETKPGHTEASLWLYLNVIGSVAMQEIFPKQFTINFPE